jgi:hypothetical protein
MTSPGWSLGGLPDKLLRSPTLKVLGARAPRSVQVQENFLVFNPDDNRWKQTEDPLKALSDFTELWKSERVDVAIQKYAAKYGVLELTPAGILKSDIRTIAISEGTSSAQLGREPLHAWKTLSRSLDGLLNIAAKLHQGEPGRPEHWRQVLPAEAVGRHATSPSKKLDHDKFWVELLIGELMVRSNLRPKLFWSGKHEFAPGIGFGALFQSGLFDALVFALLLGIVRLRGLEICACCSREFVPDKRARRGQLRYCLDCRMSGLANRKSVEEYRRRKAVEKGRSTRKREKAGG